MGGCKCLLVWLLGCKCLVANLLGWLVAVGWLLGWFVGWLVGKLLATNAWLANCLVGWLIGWQIAWLAGWLVAKLLACNGCLQNCLAGYLLQTLTLADWSVGCIGWLVGAHRNMVGSREKLLVRCVKLVG